MTLAHTYNGSALTHKVPPTSLDLPQGAELGSRDMGGVVIEDPDGDLTILGWRPWITEESACSQPRLFTGWAGERAIGRSLEEAQFVGPTARIHDLTLVGLNALFEFRIIRAADGKRPSETWIERLTWIVGSSVLTGLIADTGHVATTVSALHKARPMDAADYRGQFSSAVFSDLVDRLQSISLNWFAFWDPVAVAVGLFLEPQSEATYDSTLRISNDLADADSVTFAPQTEARLIRAPDQTYSGVLVSYAHDGSKRVFRHRQSTADTYIQRETSFSRPYTGEASTASNQAEGFLDNHAGELDRISVAIRVPRSQVGLVTAGQRMDVKLTHLPGYEAFTSVRVVSSVAKPVDDLAQAYDIPLELVSPRALGGSGAAPGVVQWASGGAALGVEFNITLDTPPGAGDVLVLAYMTDESGHYPLWISEAFTEQAAGYGYDATQYGGPGLPAHMVVYTRVVEPGDSATITIGPTATQSPNFAILIELTGVATTPSVVTETGTLTAGVQEAIADTVTGEALFLALFAIQRTSYAPADSATPASGTTELFDDDTTGEWHHCYVGHQTATTSVSVGLTMATNPYLNKWGYFAVGLAFATTEDEEETDLGAPLGTTIPAETPTPAPDGTTVLFTLANGYAAGTLIVWIDGQLVPGSEITETDPAAGEFTLSWAPDADETIVAFYIVG